VNPEPRNVADARERADEARDRMMGTFDDLLGALKVLQQKLEPSHLAKDAWQAAKSKGADLAEDAVDAVAKRPIAATGIIAAIALFIAREPVMDLVGKIADGMTSDGRKTASKRRKRNESQPARSPRKPDVAPAGD